LTVQDLITKWRLELVGGYILDPYFNETLGKYSYTLVYAGKRILSWDNAPHHPGLPNFLHHIHRPDGKVEASGLNGDPAHDLEIVKEEVETYLSQIA